ncbi:uncharacterized protein LOC143920770 [Arctopsyche grandis]|uniref:uncharacterized protein LOC143920770 n=1 Tax=Arctopsyche grandis TaxID=121162 RepID=UPI00406D8015
MKFTVIFLFILCFNYGLTVKYSNVEDVNSVIEKIVDRLPEAFAKYSDKEEIYNVLNYMTSDEFAEILKKLPNTKEVSTVIKHVYKAFDDYFDEDSNSIEIESDVDENFLPSWGIPVEKDFRFRHRNFDIDIFLVELIPYDLWIQIKNVYNGLKKHDYQLDGFEEHLALDSIKCLLKTMLNDKNVTNLITQLQEKFTGLSEIYKMLKKYTSEDVEEPDDYCYP